MSMVPTTRRPNQQVDCWIILLSNDPNRLIPILAMHFIDEDHWIRIQESTRWIPVLAYLTGIPIDPTRNFFRVSKQCCLSMRIIGSWFKNRPAGLAYLIGLLHAPPVLGWARDHGDRKPRCGPPRKNSVSARGQGGRIGGFAGAGRRTGPDRSRYLNDIP